MSNINEQSTLDSEKDTEIILTDPIGNVIDEREPSTVDFAKLLRQSSVEKKSRRKRSILVSSAQKPQTRPQSVGITNKSSNDTSSHTENTTKLTVFDEITEEYIQTEDITRFKELMTRPKDIQQYVALLPSIFSFIQLSVIPTDKRYCSENRCSIIQYCLGRLIDYFNVTLSIQFDLQNPIILYFHDLLDIGQYLIDWLIVCHREEEEDIMLDILQLENIEEYFILQKQAYYLLGYLFTAFKYIRSFEDLGLFKTQKLFRAYLSWLTLAPMDRLEEGIAFPADQLIDITFTYPEILYDSIWTVFATFDTIVDFIVPKGPQQSQQTTNDNNNQTHQPTFSSSPPPVSFLPEQFTSPSSSSHHKPSLVIEIEGEESLIRAATEPKPTIAIDCLCDLLSYVYDDCQNDIHQRIDTLLMISDYSFDSSATLLLKIALTDEFLIAMLPRGKIFLSLYEVNYDEKRWQNREIPYTPINMSANSSMQDINKLRVVTSGGGLGGSTTPFNTSLMNIFEAESLSPTTLSTPGKTTTEEGESIKTPDMSNKKPLKKRERRSKTPKASDPTLSPSALIPPSLRYDYNPVLFASYLNKVGSFFPTVKRRWFQLTDDHILRYWRNDECKEQKGMLRIINIKKVSKLERDNWFEWKTESRIHGGNFRLQCDSPELYMKWNEILYKCGVKNIEGYVPQSPPSAVRRSSRPATEENFSEKKEEASKR